MRGPRSTPCIFPEYFLQEARETVRRRTAAVRDVQRSHLVLLLRDHPDWSPDETAESVGLSARCNVDAGRWVAGDFSIEDETGRAASRLFPR